MKKSGIPMSAKVAREMKKAFDAAKKIVIVAHKNPDGDALGSTLGLYHVLKKISKAPVIILPNDFPTVFNWMPDSKKILIFEKQKSKSTEAINQADLICCLDFNHLDRIEEMGQLPSFRSKTVLMLDHHPQPDDFATFRWSNVHASSTCELVFDLLQFLEVLDQVNVQAASCLYTGLVTDTGSFRFSATTSHTLNIAAWLMDKGIKHAEIQERIFSGNKLSKLKLWGYALSQKLNFIEKYATAYIILTKDELVRYEFEEGDLEGLVNYALSVKGARLGILMTEKQDKIRMSFRSKDGFSSNNFARTYFNGGGHEMAAGGTSYESLDATVNKLLLSLEEFTQP